MSRAAVHQYRMYGLFPVGDTYRRVGGGPTVGCTVYRGEWWLHTDFETKLYWFGEPWGGPDTVKGRRWFDQMLRDRMANLTALANDLQMSIVGAVGTDRTDEQIVPIIDALINDNQGHYQVNVPNRGAIEGIPDDVVVEVPAIVSKRGIEPIHVGALTPKVMVECLLPHWLDMERNLLAFKSGDRSILLWNALDSHQTRSYDQALAVMEELLSMEGHEEMNAHFEYPSNW
jgi:alpha-galactosidase